MKSFLTWLLIIAAAGWSGYESATGELVGALISLIIAGLAAAVVLLAWLVPTGRLTDDSR
jgi:hypothetical protein